MLGWLFIISRPIPAVAGGNSPGPCVTIAKWQTRVSGIHWIDEFVTEGKALNLGGDGYPYRYKAMSKHLKDTIFKGPPYVRHLWGSDYGDILTSGWSGRTVVDRDTWEACDPEEWLDIEVWDES